jgi:hypothetical protein
MPRSSQARGVCRAVLAVAPLVLTLSASPLVARPASEVADAAERAIRSLALQTELPRERELAAPEPPFRLPPEVLWIALTIGAGVLLYAIRHDLPILRLFARKGWDTPAAAPVASEPEPSGDRRSPADELARDGRFVDAMHVLLLESLEQMRGRVGLAFSDSLTSREILRSPQLSEPARALFGDIVGLVERSYFGGRAAVRADYERCRQSFDALAQSLGGAVSA